MTEKPCSNAHTNSPASLTLLADRSARPDEQAATEKRDELAPPHSMTSSARTISEGGIVSPSAFAVLRLMIITNFVPCSIGKSAGFSPFKILSTYLAAR